MEGECMADETLPDLPAREMLDAIAKEFSGDTRPATVEMIAKLYGQLAVMQDCVIAAVNLTTAAAPNVIFTKQWGAITESIAANTDGIAKALIALSPSEGSDDDQP
jgi:hypothetical protein